MHARNLLLLTATVVLLVAALFSTAASQPPPPARRTVFSTLKAGQSVTLTDKGGLFEIGTMDEGTPLTHKVVEIGDDFIVLRDDAGILESRVPVTAVRAVVHLKIKAK